MPLASRTRPLLRIRRLTTAMRIAAYLAALAATIALAWHYPFLFELPVIVAIGLLYWAFFAGKGGSD